MVFVSKNNNQIEYIRKVGYSDKWKLDLRRSLKLE